MMPKCKQIVHLLVFGDKNSAGHLPFLYGSARWKSCRRRSVKQIVQIQDAFLGSEKIKKSG
jgi:hypothetical protein